MTIENPKIDASVVICTCDRPVLLSLLLDSLRQQQSSLRFEIIVVDNSSTITPREPCDGIRWVHETRPGVSYARNAGIRAAAAPVIAFLDDDMTAPVVWLDSLVRPILEDGYDAVIGITEPRKLDTAAEQLFEAYGGHGHSGCRFVFDRAWLASHRLTLPLWTVGGLGNAAIHRDVFTRAGYFDELLGPGTPIGSWEDLDLVYRILLSGFRILQNPDARVSHSHRENMAALSFQLCAYRRGEVAFCLLTAIRHHDPRAITHLLLWIPHWRLTMFIRELWRRATGRRLFHFGIMGRELWAYATGPTVLAAAVCRRRISLRTTTNRVTRVDQS